MRSLLSWPIAAAVFLTALSTVHSAETVALSSLDLNHVQQGWGKARANLSVDGNPLTIGGATYQSGVGTHAESVFHIALKGGSTSFAAVVGVDDEINGETSARVEFEVVADGRSLWKSGEMGVGDVARPVKADLTGVSHLILLAHAVGDSINFDHADWADASFQVNGEAPQAVDAAVDPAVVLTPKPPATPRINGPKIFGVRPGSPFFFAVAATGDRPMEFSAEGLPPGLRIDAATGQITGSLPQAGEHRVTLRAKNTGGAVERPLRIVVGEKIALTPPMGWNSWNCWAESVDQDKVLRSARSLVSSGLAQHGWSYVNIDDTWQAKRTGAGQPLGGNEKFPDMARLCAEIHSMGLHAGIYSTPWVSSYAGFPGGGADAEDGAWKHGTKADEYGHRLGRVPFAAADAKQWAAWGFDYLKYDWHPNDVPHTKEMADALRASGRDIVYSLSNSAPFENAADWARLANCWRTTGDIRDTWQSMSRIGFSQERWAPSTGPGHWNDPDMLVVGYVGWGPKLHPSQLTPNAQYTHISLWCLLSAPLLIGCDLERLDDFTLGLLTNDEVLEVNQDPLGKPARWLSQGGQDVVCKPMEDGSYAVGLFNRSSAELTNSVKWSDLGVSGRQTVRDLWRQKDLGVVDGAFEAKVPPQGVVLVRIAPAK